MSAPRRILRWQDRFDPAIGYTFPMDDYEWESQASLRVPVRVAIGRDYAVDMLGLARAPIQPVSEVVRFTLVATTPSAAQQRWDEMARVFDRVGRGQLVAELPDEMRQIADARLQAAPLYAVSANSWMRQPVQVQFVRLSHWYSEGERDAAAHITASGQRFDVAIGGTTATDRIVITLTATAAGGYASPTISDIASGASITVNRTAASSGAMLRIDVAAQRAAESVDGGTTWLDVSDYVVIPDTQVGWWQMRPPTATVELVQSSTPSVMVHILWRDAWI